MQTDTAHRPLVLMDRAAKALAEAKSIDDVMNIRDQAEAARVYAKKRDMGDRLIADASAIKLRAERRLGEMLKDVVLHEGGRPPKPSNGSTVFRLEDVGLTRNESSCCQKVADVPEEDFHGYVSDSLTNEEPPTALGLLRRVNGSHVSNNSGNNEWYTPDEFLDAARAVMGGIDLDPATSIIAQDRVQAASFYTIEEDGLQYGWGGRVWMNPPYSADLVGRFIEKLCEHVEEGEITQAIVLTNNATETAWFQGAIAIASAACFPRGRVRYLDASGKPANSPLQGQVVLYFGGKVSQFVKHFGPIGACLFGQECRK